ncbi:hypothetical protein EYF80_018534 [Liparis tanakae]|uniref:Uncharacterized protein n=1 Tax=Liparis tanakae TaxID=230148 RepID=A0A4Z2HZH2_9TELE|nr:hypothetical protein EYF80_018534 [Liparis tanakae]
MAIIAVVIALFAAALLMRRFSAPPLREEPARRFGGGGFAAASGTVLLGEEPLGDVGAALPDLHAGAAPQTPGALLLHRRGPALMLPERVLRVALSPVLRQLVLGQPVGHFDLGGHHGGLKGTKLLPHAPLRARPGLRSDLRRSVFGGRFARRPGVKLNGEGGVAVDGLRSSGLWFSRGGFAARFARRGSVLGGDLKVARLLAGSGLRARLWAPCTFFGVCQN